MATVRKTTVVNTEIPDDEVNDEVRGSQTGDNSNPAISTNDSIPLLPNIALEDIPKVMELCITRTAPNPGYLGNSDTSLTLQELKDRFGGKRINVRAVTRGHKFVKGGSETYDIVAPLKETEENSNGNGRGFQDDTRIDALLEGLGGVHEKLDGNNKGEGTTNLLQILLAKNSSEQRLAEIKLEELQIRQAEDRARFEREMSLKEKDIENKLELAKEEINLKKAQIEADRVKAENEAKEERTRSEKEAKEAREAWDRRQQEVDRQRKDELERIENSRKADLDRMRQEAKDKEERDRQFYSAQQEGQQKFQVLMAQLGKQKESNTLETVQLIQAIREMFGGEGDGEEKGDPMSKLMEALPTVAMAIANRGAAPVPAAPPPRQIQRQPVPPPQPQELEIPMHSSTRKGKKGGHVMPTAPAAAQAQPKPMPKWAEMLAFAVQFLSIELMGDIIDELHEHKNKPISDNLYAQITQAPLDLVKGYLRTVNPVFTDNAAVWNKLVAVREYLNLPPEDEEDEEPEVDAGAAFSFEAPSAPTPPAPVAAPEAAGSGVEM